MSPINNPAQAKKWLVILLVLGATLFVYWPVGHYHFIDYDDTQYVSGNSHTKQGLTWDNLRWACTSVVGAIWHPLTMMSHMLDCQLYGLNPSGHHLTSLFLHLINVALLFWLLYRMTGNPWPSAFAAGLFALHPLNVDSVAWIAERKNVLSTLFWILTLIAYVRYVRRPGPANYLLVVISFFLGLLSKPMLVTLPCVLLVLDYWPLGRFKWQSASPISPVTNGGEAIEISAPQGEAREPGNRDAYPRTTWQLALEKAPLFLLALAVGIIAVKTQHDSGGMRANIPISMGGRLGNAAVAYGAYLVKMAWPVNLAVFYPHPGASLAAWWVCLAVAALTVITLLVIWKGRRFPYLIAGWLWYVITLLPVSGIIQVGDQAMADRYAYIPLIGIFVLLAWGIRDITYTLHLRKSWVLAIGACVLIILSLVTRNQVGYWRSDQALFQHAIDVTNNNYVAENGLGSALMAQGDLNEGMMHLAKAVELNPNYSDAQDNLGIARMNSGNLPDAILHFQLALSIDKNPLYYCNLGLALAREGKFEEAIPYYHRAIELMPDFSEAHSNLAFAFEATHQFKEVLIEFAKAVHLKPNSNRAQLDLAQFLIHHQDLTGELPAMLNTDELRPYVTMYNSMGIMASGRGKPAEAAKDYGNALKLDPANEEAHKSLAALATNSTRVN